MCFIGSLDHSTLFNGVTISIVGGQTKFLGKLISVSSSASKRAAGKQMITRLTSLLYLWRVQALDI